MNFEILDQETVKNYNILKNMRCMYLKIPSRELTLVGDDVIQLTDLEFKSILAFHKKYVFHYRGGGCESCVENRLNFICTEYDQYLKVLKEKYFGD